MPNVCQPRLDIVYLCISLFSKITAPQQSGGVNRYMAEEGLLLHKIRVHIMLALATLIEGKPSPLQNRERMFVPFSHFPLVQSYHNLHFLEPLYFSIDSGLCVDGDVISFKIRQSGIACVCAVLL